MEKMLIHTHHTTHMHHTHHTHHTHAPHTDTHTHTHTHLSLNFIKEKLLLEMMQSIVSTVTVEIQWIEDIPGEGGEWRAGGGRM